MSNSVSIIVGDQQPVFCAGMSRVFAHDADFHVIAECLSWQQLRQSASQRLSAIVVASTSIINDLASLIEVARLANNRILLIIEDTESHLRYGTAGASGIIRRSADASEFRNQVRSIRDGIRRLSSKPVNRISSDLTGFNVTSRLSRKELQVLSLIMEGMKNRAIAERLGTTEQVVKNYLRAIFDKTGVSDRLELAIYTMNHPALHLAANDSIAVVEGSRDLSFAAIA